MSQPLTPLRKRAEARHTPARRSRWYRPHFKPLEDRCLLSVSLTDSAPPVPLVGSPVTWTATATGHGTTPVYQFSVGPIGGPSYIVRDFSTSNSFTWDPVQQGGYEIQVTVENTYGATGGESASATYTAQSRVVGTNAVISPTANPLVALFSAPPSAGSSMYVQFSQQGTSLSWTSTAPQPIVSGESTNFLVAGLLPSTTYLMRYVLNDGTTSAPLAFTTGALPRNLTFPTVTDTQSPGPGTDLTQNLNLHFGVLGSPSTVETFATNLNGIVNWYYNDPSATTYADLGVSLVPGGSVLVMANAFDGQGDATILREINLAGDTLRETNVDAVNAELAAMGQPAITDFNHDAERLPNGDTAVIAHIRKTVDLNGVPTSYLGDDVVVLDKNFQVAWTWDAFDWLDTNRLPTLGEGPGDWLHANSVAFSPADGNLIVSLRSQDWVIKIDYDDGAGDGHVVWRLGKGGDFTINSADPSPWFSHQHDVRYVNDSTLTIFDDGNTRRASNPNADSRGQELVLDEQTMQATLVVNADLGNYSLALGSAERLPSGDFVFNSGYLGTLPNVVGQTIEVLPNGTKTFVQQITGLEYRSYLMNTLYGPLTNLYDPGFEDPSQGSAWSFVGPAGEAANGSSLTAGNPNAPQGSQVAYIQQTGTISQAVDFYAAGSYVIGVSAAQRGNVGTSSETVQVEVDGSVVDTITPAGSGYVAYTTAPLNLTAGSHTITFVGVNASGPNDAALLDNVSIGNAPPPIYSDPGAVDLTSAFNRTGIVADGSTFSGGGLDLSGNALSSSLIGTSLIAAGSIFDLGPVGTSDVVSASGQAIPLPTGNDAALKLVATAVNGDQTNQTFVVTYTDGTTATFTQSISDWNTPQHYAGESIAATTAYRDTSSGGRLALTFDVYDYTLGLDPSKQVKSITLPNDADVEILAATLVPAGATQVDLSSAFNRTGIVADGSTFSGGGLDLSGNALSTNLLGPTVTAGGQTFKLGAIGSSNVVSAAGQTIALPAGSDRSLLLLATAVNGDQTNQTFVVTYTDGTTATFTQSISDWNTPQHYAGESIAATTAYRDTSSGGRLALTFDVYDYTLGLDPSKQVKSITLPNDADVEVLAATLVPSSSTEVGLESSFNRTGIAVDGQSFSGGLDGTGYALSGNLLGTSLTVGGVSFSLGAGGLSNAISAAGQTIALPGGQYHAFSFLGAGVYGNQANQSFTVHYTDGTSQTFTQTLSDWWATTTNPGETVAATAAYLDTSSGGRVKQTVHVYKYAFALDPTKSVASITLPSDGQVEVLAMSLLS